MRFFYKFLGFHGHKLRHIKQSFCIHALDEGPAEAIQDESEISLHVGRESPGLGETD